MSAEQRRLLALNNDKNADDLSEIMFNKVGACFNQLQMPLTNIIKRNNNKEEDNTQEILITASGIKHPVQHVEDIFKICQKLLDKKICQILDQIAEESAISVTSYPYKSFTEAIYFIATSMIRHVAHVQLTHTARLGGPS